MKDSFFGEITSQYKLIERLSLNCIQSIICDTLEWVTLTSCSRLLDIGGGSGQFSSEFLSHTPVKECIIVDLSDGMLREAREHFTRLDMIQRVKLVQGDAHILPIKSDRSCLVLMSFVLNLLSDPRAALLEIRRVLSRDGWFFLITYDLPDLRSQIYHKYFPRYYEIDSQRCLPLGEVTRLITSCGLKISKVSKYPYEIRRRSVDEVIEFARTKPFSTFAKYSESEFKEAISIFDKQLRLQFGSGPVKYTSQVTLISSVKYI